MRVTERWRDEFRKGGALARDVRKVVFPEILKAEENEAQERRVDFLISNGAEDRDGDVIEVDGWELDAYKLNPVILWAHDARQLPIAKAETIGVSDGALKSTALFPEKGLSPFADQVFGFVKGGFLRGASVGFHPIEAAPMEGDKGIHFKRQELYEYSILPIPAHREALAEAKAVGLDVGLVIEWAEKTLAEAEESGLWIPRFSMERALAVVRPTQVAVPAPPSKGATATGGHAGAGAGSGKAPDIVVSQPEPEPEDDEDAPKLVGQIVADAEAEAEAREGRWELEMALSTSLASIDQSDKTDDEKRELVRQTVEQFVNLYAPMQEADEADNLILGLFDADDDEDEDAKATLLKPKQEDEDEDEPKPDDEEDSQTVEGKPKQDDEDDPKPDDDEDDPFKQDEDEDDPKPDDDPPPEEDPEEDQAPAIFGVESVDEAMAALHEQVREVLGLEDGDAKAESLKTMLEAFAGVVMEAQAPEGDDDPDEDAEALAQVEALLKEEDEDEDEAEGLTADDVRSIVAGAAKATLDERRGRLPD